jgi:DNA-binding NtrC family response regulator
VLHGSPSVLIVDGDSEQRRSLSQAFDDSGCVGAQSGSIADAIERLSSFAYDGLIVDVQLPGGDGLDVLDNALSKYPGIKCIVTANHGSVHHAVRALKRGACDYVIKPIPASQLVETMKAALSRREVPVARTIEAPVTSPKSPYGIVGSSPAMMQLFDTIGRVAPMQSTVLIQGETGTGKELVARTIHQHSTRREHPFVAFNAAAIPEGLVEAELFGHVKGAFSGAVNARVGRFEAADRGTLFIDEVASMPLALQAKLLRALQEREIERVGTSRPMKVNVRVLAATNVDLAQLVRAGTFREDLYYRLNVVRVELPALRARSEDIPQLASYFIEEACRINGIAVKTLSQPALQALMRHSWPGNVRHLQNAVESAVVMSGADREISERVLPIEVLRQETPLAELRSSTSALMPATPEAGINFASAMSTIERELILTYLRKAGGNKRQAARMLSLSRTTLIDKLHRLGVMEPAPPATTTVSIEAVA